jgi:hypothetical protein
MRATPNPANIRCGGLLVCYLKEHDMNPDCPDKHCACIKPHPIPGVQCLACGWKTLYKPSMVCPKCTSNFFASVTFIFKYDKGVHIDPIAQVRGTEVGVSGDFDNSEEGRTLNKADRERKENIQENLSFFGSLEGEDIEFLLSIIDKQDKVVKAAVVSLYYHSNDELTMAIEELEGGSDEPS